MAEAKKTVKAAVIDVRDKVPVLAKTSENQFSNYKYASIDSFYEQVKPIATKAGLGWRAQITDWQMLPDLGKNGSIAAKVQFDLFTETDEIKDYMTVPIINGFVGAQTTGQIVSYAEKVMMRAAFGVATGEGDADHTDQAQFSRENKPKPQRTEPPPKLEPLKIEGTVELPPVADKITGEVFNVNTLVERTLPNGLPVIKTRDTGIDILIAAFETFMPVPKTRAILRDWWAENVPAVEAIAREAPEEKARLVEKFRERAAQLPEK